MELPGGRKPRTPNTEPSKPNAAVEVVKPLRFATLSKHHRRVSAYYMHTMAYCYWPDRLCCTSGG